MSLPSHSQSRLARSLASVASSVILLLALCGCQTDGTSDITGSLGETANTKPAGEARRDVETWRERFRTNPTDPEIALQYGRALRDAGQRSQAVAVIEQASIAHPGNKALLAGYGRALGDNGNFQQAFDVLSRAHTPEDPDWRILSAQGAVLDQLGRHEEARQYYASALKIAPEEPSVLSNLGLSYVLSKDLPKAEEILRRAYRRAGADPRTRANLALVVGLQGRLAEAEGIVKAGLSTEEARPTPLISSNYCRGNRSNGRMPTSHRRERVITPSDSEQRNLGLEGRLRRPAGSPGPRRRPCSPPQPLEERRQERAPLPFHFAAAGQLLRDLLKQQRGAMVCRDLRDHLTVVRSGAEQFRIERNSCDRPRLDCLGEFADFDLRSPGHADLVEAIERRAVVGPRRFQHAQHVLGVA